LKYRLEIKQRAKKSLKKLKRKDQQNIIEAIQSLANVPRPKGSKKLSG
jgi:mRNA interferase RelE/StbE